MTARRHIIAQYFSYTTQLNVIHYKACKHDDVIKWKHFPRYWPFVLRIHWSPVDPHTKASDAELLMFSLICARINGWVNNGEAGDLTRHQAHYDVIVMEPINLLFYVIQISTSHKARIFPKQISSIYQLEICMLPMIILLSSTNIAISGDISDHVVRTIQPDLLTRRKQYYHSRCREISWNFLEDCKWLHLNG